MRMFDVEILVGAEVTKEDDAFRVKLPDGRVLVYSVRGFCTGESTAYVTGTLPSGETRQLYRAEVTKEFADFTSEAAEVAYRQAERRNDKVLRAFSDLF